MSLLSPYLSAGDIRCCTLGKLLFEGLTRIDISGMPRPAGAGSIHVSEDGKYYTFQLRPAHWSNGKPVTSMDYLVGWKKVLKREWISNRPELLFVIKNGRHLYHQLCHEKDLGVYAKSPTVLQIELECPDPYFLEKLAYPVFFPSVDGPQEPDCFNGPYIVKHYTHKDLDLEINPAYWDTKNVHFRHIQIGSGTIEEIDCQFQKGEIDWFGNPFGVFNAEMTRMYEEARMLHKKAITRHFFIYLNTKHFLLRSPLIRHALSHALDRSFICAHFFPNCTPLHSLFPEIEPFSENLSEAKILFTKGMSILQAVHPLPSIIIHYAQLPGHRELVSYLQKVWQNAFGITIHLQEQSWNLFRSSLEKRDFQIAGCFASEFTFDSFELLHRFEEMESSTNFSNWDHLPFQSTMHAIRFARGEEKLQLLREAAAIFTHEIPLIPICNQSLYFGKNPKLKGEVINAFGHVDFRFAFKQE